MNKAGTRTFGSRDLVVFVTPEAADGMTRLLAELTEQQVGGIRLDAGGRLERDGLRQRRKGYAPCVTAPPVDVELAEQALLVTIAAG